MSTIVDRRFTVKDGSTISRQKFIERYKKQLKKAIRVVVADSSIKDFKFGDKKIKIDASDDINLPSIGYDRDSGVFEGVDVGNKTYKKGDKVGKNRRGRGQGTQGSNKGGGEDGFEFTLTEKEFADLFFEDLELPDLMKKNFIGDVFEIQRAGFSNTGGPSSLSIKQTIIRAFMRRFALKKKYDKDGDKLIVKDEKIVVKKRKINFLEDVDLKYNHKEKVEVPSSKAVMFCLMDVSGSMGETEKDMAKRFFILLSMFLKRNYDIVDIVFVRHAEWAEECDEEVFFHGKESGGTVISTGYERIIDIIKLRYNPEQWNLYIAQATDGDNWEYDNATMVNLLEEHLLPMVQYFAYIEVSPVGRGASNVIKFLDKISQQCKNLAVKIIRDYKEIFEVFRSLFLKEKK